MFLYCFVRLETHENTKFLLPISKKQEKGAVRCFDLKADMIIIFCRLLNSPPLEGGVDSVSPKETEDEVVLPFRL